MDEVELAPDVDTCLNKYERLIRLDFASGKVRSYALQACQDSGMHMTDEDEDGNCHMCHERKV